MHLLSRTFIAAVFVASVASCRATPEPPKPAYQPTTSIKEVMDAVVAPSAQALWDAVQTIGTEKGIEEKAPHTDEEWHELEHRAITLIEATTLIQIPGRHADAPGAKAENPTVELEPSHIDHLIEQNPRDWGKLANDLHAAGMVALDAIHHKDANALLNSGETIDTACENCHKKYWYPDPKPAWN